MFTNLLVLSTVSALALSIPLSGAPAGRKAPLTHVRGKVHRVISAAPGSVTLYDQNGDDAGVAIVSEIFTHSFDSYDSYGADDFTVPAGHKWKIREVEVTGAYGQQSEPAQSENVLFYKDRKGLPGKLVAECDNLSGSDNLGSFAIKLPKTCKVNLRGGYTYWISVVAIENNLCCTNWGWETRNGQNGDPAAWENPNGSYDECPNWGVMTSCIGDYGEGPDFMFALKGRDMLP